MRQSLLNNVLNSGSSNKFLFLLCFIYVLCSCQNSVKHYHHRNKDLVSETTTDSVNLLKRLDAPTSSVSENDSSQYTEEEIESECPLEGSAESESVKELNILKNRSKFPKEEDFDTGITLSKILEEGNDLDRWSSNKAARIKGYVYDVKKGGIETCNCKNKDVDERDTHIEIILDPNDNLKSKRVIVEVTPRIRKIMKSKGIDWSTRALRDDYLGRFVEVEGWMLFDKEHENAAENTNQGRSRNWRATAWEIHPITKITLLQRNPNF